MTRTNRPTRPYSFVKHGYRAVCARRPAQVDVAEPLYEPVHNWTGELFATRAVEGGYRVGTSRPKDVPVDHATVAVYEVRGPFQPFGHLTVVVVWDLAAWIKSYEDGGFRFQLKGTGPSSAETSLAGA